MVGGTLADAGYSPRPGPRSGPSTWYAAPALAWCLVTFHSRHKPSGRERSCAAHRGCRPADRAHEPARDPERIRYVWYAQVGEDTTTVGPASRARTRVRAWSRSTRAARCSIRRPTTSTSLGKESSSGASRATERLDKPGCQYRLEPSSPPGGSAGPKELVGGHTVRRDRVHDCGQSGPRRIAFRARRRSPVTRRSAAGTAAAGTPVSGDGGPLPGRGRRRSRRGPPQALQGLRRPWSCRGRAVSGTRWRTQSTTEPARPRPPPFAGIGSVGSVRCRAEIGSRGLAGARSRAFAGSPGPRGPTSTDTAPRPVESII